MNHFRFFLFLTVSLLMGPAFAQSQKAMVVNDGALVYVNPDFDSELLTELKAGTVYDVSLKTKGPFYKIRVRPKVTGWIADTDVKVGKFNASAVAKQSPQDSKNAVKPGSPAGAAAARARAQSRGKDLAKNKENAKDKDKNKEKENNVETEASKRTTFLERRKKRPFDETRFRGPTLSSINYIEDTMGAQRTQSLPFFGLKVEGPNTLFSGDLRTNAELLFHFGAPDFYEKATGTKADGWIFLTDFIFETALPQSNWHMITFGFGPMFKYTHYGVTLQENGKPLAYSLDDMTLGAVFDGGLGFRLGSYALRFNAKYYWEKTRYWGGSLTFGFPF